jgi:hypothetical protein
MSKLPKYTLTKNESKDRWDLKSDATNRVVSHWDTKTAATTGGVLSGALGKQGGSVKIQLESGRFQEERTFPRSADPKGTKG